MVFVASVKYIVSKNIFLWAIPRPTAECLAKFFHQHIYCRYLAPGVIIHDRGGEFCNKICGILHEKYRVQVNVIAAGKPQGNGQAESMVKKMKEKMRAFMIESCDFFIPFSAHILILKLFWGGNHDLPKNWDDTLLYTAGQVIRSDPSTATGYAPAEILLARPVIYPCELGKMEIDFEGNSHFIFGHIL